MAKGTSSIFQYVCGLPFIRTGIKVKGLITSLCVSSTGRNRDQLVPLTERVSGSLDGTDATFLINRQAITVSDRRDQYYDRIYLKFMQGDHFQHNIIIATTPVTIAA